MYYKIENTTCELFKKLHQLRTEELRMEKENLEAIFEKIGKDWVDFKGELGERCFQRVTQYSGFKFKNPKQVDTNIWKEDVDHPGIYIPNLKFKEGRKMNKFLHEELQRSSLLKLFKILGITHIGRFSYPAIYIFKDLVVLDLDECFKATDTNLIEITSVEFESIYDSLK